MARINVYDKIIIENQNKESMEIKENFLHKSPSNRWFRNGIYSLLIRADARGSADIVYIM